MLDNLFIDSGSCCVRAILTFQVLLRCPMHRVMHLCRQSQRRLFGPKRSELDMNSVFSGHLSDTLSPNSSISCVNWVHWGFSQCFFFFFFFCGPG